MLGFQLRVSQVAGLNSAVTVWGLSERAEAAPALALRVLRGWGGLGSFRGLRGSRKLEKGLRRRARDVLLGFGCTAIVARVNDIDNHPQIPIPRYHPFDGHHPHTTNHVDLPNPARVFFRPTPPCLQRIVQGRGKHTVLKPGWAWSHDIYIYICIPGPSNDMLFIHKTSQVPQTTCLTLCI